MKVFVPSPLRSYTTERAEVDGTGTNLHELLADLDRQYPGIRFRIINEQDCIRTHIKIFVNHSPVQTLSYRLEGNEQIHIIAALSGG